MFIAVALTFAVIMLAGVNAIVWWRRRPTLLAACVCAICAAVPLCPFLYCRPLIAQALLLLLSLGLVYIPRRGPVTYHVVSVLVTAAVWLVAVGNAVLQDRETAELRAAYPFESMADRTPKPGTSDGKKIADGAVWQGLEEKLRGADSVWVGRRTGSLFALHEGRLAQFHRAMGFGAGRLSDPNFKPLSPDLTPPVPQPEGYEPNAVSLGDEMPADPQKPFLQLHANSLLDFVNPDGWGYVKSRTQVAGFRPHRFSRVPEPVEKWEVRRVELVGLLRHEEPAVYVSEHLPRMDELTGAKTRAPDSFEAEGLKEIRGGHDLFARGSEDDVRMVGAIRSVEQCVQCHGGGRGDLLGAFSYRLRKGDTK